MKSINKLCCVLLLSVLFIYDNKAYGQCATTNLLPKSTGSGTICSQIYDNGTTVGIATTSPNSRTTVDIQRPASNSVTNPIGLNVSNPDNGTVTYPLSTGIRGDVSGSNYTNYGGDFSASNGSGNYGIHAYSTVSTNAYSNYGGAFEAANGSNQSISVIASTGYSTSPYNYGVYSTSNGGTNSYGGWFFANNATNNYGIYATTNGTQSSTNCAAYFGGSAYASGTFNPSDENLKENIQSAGELLPLLRKLDIKTYDFKTKEHSSMNLPQGRQIGLLAQNMKSVFPALVQDMLDPGRKDPKTGEVIAPETKFMAVNYAGLVPVLIGAVKELDAKTAQISTLQAALDNNTAELTSTKAMVADLQQQLNDICSGGCAGLRGTGNSGATGNILLQNTPNPFARQTSISYVFNGGSAAYMNINSLDGKMIRHIDLAKGQGTVTIDASELSAGTYTYSLYVDDKVTDTKIMVISGQK